MSKIIILDKDIVDTTSPTVASNDKAKKLNEKTTESITMSITTSKSNLSGESKSIFLKINV